MKFVKTLTIIVILIAGIVVLPTTLTSGWRYCNQDGSCSIQFWGAHEHDGVWHLAVSRILMEGKGQVMPTLAGYELRGYNIMLDWIVAIAALVSQIPLHHWYFRIIPLAWFVGMIVLLKKVGEVYKLPKVFLPYAIIFSMLGTSFSYLITIANNQGFNGASAILSMQSALTLFNPQLGLSLFLLLMYLIIIAQKRFRPWEYALIGILLAGVVGLKFYTGVVMGVMVAGWLGQNLRNELSRLGQLLGKVVLLGLPVLIASSLYSPGSGDFPLIFKPFAPVNPLVEDSSLLYIPALANRLYATSGVSLLVTELLITMLFIVMNFGTRLFGIAALVLQRTKLTILENQLIIGTTVGLILSVTLVQTGVWWNTVQFLHVSLFTAGLLAASGIARISSGKNFLTQAMVATLLILTILPNLDVVRTYAKYPGTSQISSDEMEALAWLAAESEGVVYVPPFVPTNSTAQPPLLSESYDTAIIPAYTGKQVYLADTTQLELLTLPYQERVGKMTRFECDILTEVEYLYEEKRNPYVDNFGTCRGTVITKGFENNWVKIYRVGQ